MSRLSVSVVIPAYRAAKTIVRAVDSALAQTCPPAEILVVDDGSPDDLAAPLRPYGDPGTLICKPNRGPASARNLGIERARGNLIAFLDADDYWERTKLERQIAVFERHPEVGLVAGQFFEQAPASPERTPSAMVTGPFDEVLALSGAGAFELATRIWTGTVVVRRDVVGEQRFVSGLEPAEDRDLWVRLVMARPAYLLAEPLATAVLEPGSLSRTNIDRDYGNMLRVVHRNGELLGRRGVCQWESKVYRKWAARYLGEGHPRSALPLARKRLRYQPFSPEAWWVLLKCAALACCPPWAAPRAVP